MIIEQIETVIIGGGQAGLAMSHYLGQLGREHVILERQRVAERWRSERWDFPEPELERSSARICLSVCRPRCIRVTMSSGRVPEHKRWITSVPRVYFRGLPWLYKRKSAFLHGVGEDAEYLAEHIANGARP